MIVIFFSLLEEVNIHEKSEFLVIPNEGWCFNNIFKVAKEDYLKYFFDAHIDLKRNKKDIEHTYFRKIENAYNEGLDIGSFLEGRILAELWEQH